MARVMIECPSTGEPIFTGMTFDWPSFENVKIGQKQVRCSSCGEDHKWKRPDAYLDLSSHTKCIIFGRGCEFSEDLIG